MLVGFFNQTLSMCEQIIEFDCFVQPVPGNKDQMLMITMVYFFSRKTKYSLCKIAKLMNIKIHQPFDFFTLLKNLLPKFKKVGKHCVRLTFSFHLFCFFKILFCSQKIITFYFNLNHFLQIKWFTNCVFN